MASETSKLKKTTLKERGNILPLGSFCKGQSVLSKSISFKPWLMKQEKELGSLRDRSQQANMSEYVGMVLATMIDKVAGQDFESMKFEERRFVISQMYMCDVFYAYVLLRIEAMGTLLKVKITCPNCQKQFPFTADLETIDVVSAENLDDAKWDYKLKHPFEVRGKKVETLTIGPTCWTMLENMRSDESGAAKTSLILNSIYVVEGEEIALAESELDEMRKMDIEMLSSMIDEKHLGPNMAIEDVCKRCGGNFTLPIKWGYDSFFGASSL